MSKKPWQRSRWICPKCGVHTGKNREYYSVHDELWDGVLDRWKLNKYGNGMICIGCFEKLLGRYLNKHDFKDCEVNSLECVWNLKSDRLCDRLTSESPA